MADTNKYNKVDVVIVGGGPAGISAGIALKKLRPDLDVCVIEKGKKIGNHNLSGAALEKSAIDELFTLLGEDFKSYISNHKVFEKKAEKDQVLFMPDNRFAFNIKFTLSLAKLFKMPIGQMEHKGDYVVSVSELTRLLGEIARKSGVEIYEGFSVEEVVWDESKQLARGVNLVEQGLNKAGEKGRNSLAKEFIEAQAVVLAEGCDGYVTEKFIGQAKLEREAVQQYSIGVKEVIQVSENQYQTFSQKRVVHAMGYPLWRPVLGPAIFGGGVMYAMGDNKIAIGMIAAMDWKCCDFNPQDALARFKEHRFVKRFIDGGTVIEAGAKMIPEAGFRAIPRDARAGSIGKSNVVLLGDSAGLVNMIKIKGLHNAILSGIAFAKAAAEMKNEYANLAQEYTSQLKDLGVLKEMYHARKFRQVVSKFGLLFGLPLAGAVSFLPAFEVEEDYKNISKASYPFKLEKEFSKHDFVAMARTDHREDQPCHLIIEDSDLCLSKCVDEYKSPCITFCPAGVYDIFEGRVVAANPSNCLHCKTCQRKCPFNNIHWKIPEGGSGPGYELM